MGRLRLVSACWALLGGTVFLFGSCAVAADSAQVPDQPEITFLYGQDEIFPSALVCFTGTSSLAPQDEDQLGDTRGVLAVRFRAPADNTHVRVTFFECPFFEESSVAVNLPKAGKVYHIAPIIRYRIEKLAAQSQPLANFVIRAGLSWGDSEGAIEGNRRHVELHRKIVVHSINDWVLRYVERGGTNSPVPAVDGAPRSGRKVDAMFMIAAYVNENNSWIDLRVTRHAIDRGYVDYFDGYQRGPAQVMAQVRAIYQTLGDFGFRYVFFPRESAVAQGQADPNPSVEIQNVRLVGDSLASAQAGATETAALLASVCLKLDIRTRIFFIQDKSSKNQPFRPLLGFYLSPECRPEDLRVIAPNEVGHIDFETALCKGYDAFEPNRAHLVFEDTDGSRSEDSYIQEEKAAREGYVTVDITSTRLLGILPIPEARREVPITFRAPSPDSFVLLDPQNKVVGYATLGAAATVEPAAVAHPSASTSVAKKSNHLLLVGGAGALLLAWFWYLRTRQN